MVDKTKAPDTIPSTPSRSTISILAIVLPLILAGVLAVFFPTLQDAVSYIIWVASPITHLPAVTLEQGTYVGKTIQHGPVPIHEWLGVPYVKAPIGNLRFARPQSLGASNQTFNAWEHGYRCPPGGKSVVQLPNAPEPNEDCLTLNIFRQRTFFSPGKLPVMVYVHGGAFNRGFAAGHDTATMLASSTKPFLAISFNYRISALGFLNSESTAEQGLLNLGLHDQVALLEWIQQNVAAFGGNPKDVTLVGLSAGAHSIGHHIMNVNEPRELFHKAVIESGGIASRAVHPPNSQLHQVQFDKFIDLCGCTSEPREMLLTCLRNAPSDTVLAAQVSVFEEYNPSVRWAWQPVIDDDIISRRPLDAWKSGNWHKVPILTGFNHNEGSMYVPKSTDTSQEFADFFATLLPQLSQADLHHLDTLYPDPAATPSSPYTDTRDVSALRIGSQFKRVEAAYGHYAYVCPVRQTALYGSTVSSDPPVYLYHWALNSSVLQGANHGDQMWYETLSTRNLNISSTHEEIAKNFHAYVTSFVLTGDPNKVPGLAPKRPRWTPWAKGEKTMIFGEGNDEAAGGVANGVAARMVEDMWAKEECRFWWDKAETPED